MKEDDTIIMEKAPQDAGTYKEGKAETKQEQYGEDLPIFSLHSIVNGGKFDEQ